MATTKTLFYVSCVALFLAAVVVVLGAFTRLVDAGLGCPDWPTCYGHLWVPDEHHEIASANEKFSDTPVETDKTWPEQIHRIFASTLGLFILAIFALAYKNRESEQPWRSVIIMLVVLVAGLVSRVVVGDKLDPFVWFLVAAYFGNLLRLRQYGNLQTAPFILPSLLAGMVILQGFFGMWTVTLKLWPQVVTAHLLGGFTTLSLLWLLVQRSGNFYWRAKPESLNKLISLQWFALAVLIVVVFQIALGGWTSSNYAALACPDFPTCQNSWWPVADYLHGFNVFQELGPNYLGGLLEAKGRIAIHFSHRLGALLVAVLTVVLALRLFASGLMAARIWAGIALCVLSIQLSLGISNVVLALPLGIAVIHNAVGAILLLVIVAINHRLRTLSKF